jgi:hypothetical protein
MRSPEGLRARWQQDDGVQALVQLDREGEGIDISYMSRYGFEESIRDGATKPLHFEPRLLEMHINRDAIDDAFRELTGGLSDLDRELLAKTAVSQVWSGG